MPPFKLFACLAASLLFLSSLGLTAPGDFDAAFNSTGKVTTAIGNSADVGRGVVVQPDGKIVVAGHSSNGSNWDFAVTRYNANGSLDTSFGSGGKATTSFGSRDDVALAVALQSDGKIVLGGFTNNGTRNIFALIRYTSTGALDTTFGGGGVATAIGTGNDQVNSLAVQSDGKILAVGYAYTGTYPDVAVVRYNSDGSPDVSFGGNSNGIVTTPIGSSYDYGWAVAVQSDGKIVVGGLDRNDSGNDDFALLRYTSTGILDNGFGSNGKVTTGFNSGREDAAYALALQSDGKIVIGGRTHNGSNFDFALARFTSTGAPDSNFGSSGQVTTTFGSGDEEIDGLAIQRDGKIVAIGQASNGSNLDFAVARYNSNGSLDTTFSGDGKVLTTIGSANDIGQGVAVQTDGKIVVAGYSDNGTNNDFAVVRYLGGPVIEQSGPISTTDFIVAPIAGQTETFNNNGFDITVSGVSSVGRNGTGTLNQTTGTHNTTALYVGENAGSSGTYNLSGTSVLNSGANLFIGRQPSSSGNFTQSGGSISVTDEYVGTAGVGSLTQTGGTNNSQHFFVGGLSGGSGTFDLQGGSVTPSVYLRVGADGTGTLTQSGGSIVVPTLVIANGPGVNGTYSLSGTGTLTTTTASFVGNSGSGSFSQTNGAHTTSTLYLAKNSGSSGTYQLDGGLLSVSSLQSGSGTAAFTFNKGTLSSTNTSLDLGANGFVVGNGTSVATLNLEGGAHTVANGIHVKANAVLNPVGSQAGSVAVFLEGGTLKGDAAPTLGSITASSGSTINLGDSGASTVTLGDLALTNGVTYQADVTDASGCDQLNSTGTVNLGGATLNLRLRFVPSGLRTFRIVQKSVGSGSVAGTFAGLPEGAVFSVNDSGGTPRACYITYAGGDGNDVEVVVNVPAPQVGTGSPTGVSGSGATLMGQVNPNGGPTQVRFEYGTTTLYGNSTPIQDVNAGTGIVNVNAAITGLSSGTTYHYRLVATNPGGTTNGNDVDFVATSGSGSGATAIPTLATNAVSGITTTSATLSGTVNPNGGATTAQFEYGETATYGQATVSEAMGSGTNPVPIQKILTGLTPGTVYHYRLTASNLASGGNGGPNQTVDAMFTTNFLSPTVTTTAPSTAIAGATLRGKVNPNGVATTAVFFEYGADTTYGASVPVAGPFTGRDPLDVSATIAAASLTPGNTYHYRLVATTSVGTSPGNDATFIAVVPPAATTEPATDVTTAGVTLHGTVTPNQFDVNVSFEVAESEAGLGTGSATTVGATPASFATGLTTPQTVSAANVTGFGLGQNGASKTYYYRTVATATSGGGGTIFGDTETFTVQNTAPVAHDDAFVILGNEQLDVLANDSDIDPDDTLRIVSVDPPAGGSGDPRISVDGKKISYNPNDLFPDQADGDSFAYAISDRATGGLTASATVRVFSVKVLRGLYSGLIGGTGDGADAAGRLDITLSPTGQVTGSFKWLGRLYAFKGGAPLGSDGKLTITKPKIGEDGRTVAGAVVELTLTLDPVARVLTGTLTDTETNPDTVVQAELTGTVTTDEVSTLPEVGTFNAYIDTGTAAIPVEGAAPEMGATLLPHGVGFAQVVVAKSGKKRPARFAGRMPDDQPFSSGARALVQALRAAAGARYPLYVDNLYPKVRRLNGRPQNGGFVSGNVAFTKQNDRFDSGLNWERRPNVGTRFPQGFRTGLAAFTATLNAIRYNRPLAGNLPAGIPNDTRTVNAKIDFTEGDLGSTITHALKLTRAGNGPVRARIEPLNTTLNTESITLTINAAGGKFSGSFIHPADTANPDLRKKPRTKFNGIFQGQNGEGTFTGPNNTGRIQIIGQ